MVIFDNILVLENVNLQLVQVVQIWLLSWYSMMLTWVVVRQAIWAAIYVDGRFSL